MTTLVMAPQLTGSEKFKGKQPLKETTMKYGKVDLGQIEALINKVGGEQGMKMILSGRAGIVPLRPWQKIMLGNLRDEEALREALDAAGSGAGFADGSGKSSPCIHSIEICRPQTVDLVIVKVEDLGLPCYAKTEEIYRVADSLDLDYCPDETAAQVLLQCNFDMYQAAGRQRQLQFAMDPRRRGGHGFRIREHNGKNYLSRFTNQREHVRSAEEKFVFVLRK